MTKYDGAELIYFRVILANPLTKQKDINKVLEHQLKFAQHELAQEILNEIKQRCS